MRAFAMALVTILSLSGCGGDDSEESAGNPEGLPTNCIELRDINLELTQDLLSAWDKAGVTFAEAQDPPPGLGDRIGEHLPPDHYERGSELATASETLDCDPAASGAYFCEHSDQLEAKSSGSEFFLSQLFDGC